MAEASNKFIDNETGKVRSPNPIIPPVSMIVINESLRKYPIFIIIIKIARILWMVFNISIFSYLFITANFKIKNVSMLVYLQLNEGSCFFLQRQFTKYNRC